MVGRGGAWLVVVVVVVVEFNMVQFSMVAQHSIVSIAQHSIVCCGSRV